MCRGLKFLGETMDDGTRRLVGAVVGATLDKNTELCERLTEKVARGDILSEEDVAEFKKVTAETFPSLYGDFEEWVKDE